MHIIDLNCAEGPIPFDATSIALGNFDGFHNGHRELIRRTIQIERSRGYTSAVLLFKTHTRDILNTNGTGQLNSLNDKLQRLQGLGVSCVFLVEFDREFMNQTKEEFLDDFLIGRLRAKSIVVGDDYRFGRKAEGDVAFLKSRAEKTELKVDIIPEVRLEGLRISSTRIREALRAGAVEWANTMLGYPYRVRGTIVRGASRGHNLGFPTANLKLDFPYVIPKDGVYLTLTRFEGEEHGIYGMTNIGTNPTFTDENVTKIETYLFDFSGDCYGKYANIEFLRYERSDMKFESADELIAQMRRDDQMLRDWASIYRLVKKS